MDRPRQEWLIPARALQRVVRVTGAASRVNGLWQVAALGAGGGAVNAWLCFAKIPVPIEDGFGFDWLVVPAGAFHGAVLALLPVAAAIAMHRRTIGWRIVAAPAVGWLSGYFSWIPLNAVVFDESWARSLPWPWYMTEGIDFAWVPFAYFGLVGLLWYLVAAMPGPGRSRGQLPVLAACAGVLGSLWFWIEYGQWYFAVIHGTIWGLLVGWSASRISSRTE